ncbi:choice-of-anchor D domain-containing protein [Vibrio sp. ZSDZ34]|uniref:Choice-of-anchor D domain-containing protein n=1 Tax=Vibrio gelatinilyticus TaxID=2893468 RepID=A0A9X1WDN7_9VIBR|nr:choice-of-anchor D domain-containing protein [Vibrio gelatinilyticus]MCJ2376500.1 choice-of-anchor D domain-containing protein [Vibrio gelatinilyticus]
MKLSTLVPIIIGSAMSASVYADVIFEDNFDSGVSNWDSSGNVQTDSSYSQAGLSAYLKETGQISRTVDISSANNVSLSFAMASRLLEDSDYCYAEYSTNGGATYSIIASLGNGQDNATFYPSVQAISDSADSVTIRFRASAGTADHCYIDDVVLQGDMGQVVEQPVIDVEDSLSFGSITIGNQANKTLVVANAGQQPLFISSISNLSGDFAVLNDQCSNTNVAASSACNIELAFNPQSLGTQSTSLDVNSNDPANPTATVAISGYGSQDQSQGYIENYQPLSGSGVVSRSELTYQQLNGGNVTQLVSNQAFALPEQAAQPEHQFEGRITLNNPESAGVGQFTEHEDTYRYTSNADDPRKHIPPFSYDFVQTGTHLIPVQRGIQLNSHEYWEYILEPGRVWKETSDNGKSRASIPFSLMQKNSNCVHNGLMTFTFDNSSMSDVAYQIASETCLYYKFDMWGSVAATYQPQSVTNSLDIKQAHQAYEASKIQTKPIEELVSDFPSSNIDVANFGHSSEVSPEHMTLYGVFVDDVHYVGGCGTRQGLHPYCERLRVPSYSTAKTALAGTASMRLELLYPGYMQSDLTDLIPEAAADPEGDWLDVTPDNAIDMATGNYRLSSGYLSDEYSTANDTGFFLVLDHNGKLDYSVSRYPRKAQPGTFFNYHTTDTYIATVAAQNFVKAERGQSADVFADIIVNDIWKPLNVDLGTQDTRRTYDSVAMPFGGYGLTYLRDDIIKITKFTSIDRGQINGQQMLDAAELEIALFADPTSPPLDVRSDSKYYSNSVWSKLKTLPGGCEQHVPYMSGYGGIQFVMLPNDVIYYYVSDNNEFAWDLALQEGAKISPYCQ